MRKEIRCFKCGKVLGEIFEPVYISSVEYSPYLAMNPDDVDSNPFTCEDCVKTISKS